MSIWIFRPPWNSCLRSFVLCESRHLTVRWWAHGSKDVVSNLYSNCLSSLASKVSLRDYIFASNLVQLPLSSKIHCSLKFPSVQSDGNVEWSVFFIHDWRDGHVDSCNAICPYLFHQRVLLYIILSLSKKYLSWVCICIFWTASPWSPNKFQSPHLWGTHFLWFLMN